MNKSASDQQNEILYNTIFRQIQDCGDIISSILLIYKFLTDNNISITFHPQKLRCIALRSCDSDTSTYLWHINSIIAASSDFEHLLLGIEMMFERFLGNKQLYIKEKEKLKLSSHKYNIASSSKITSAIQNNQSYIGNEIYSVVNTCYNNMNKQKQTTAAPAPAATVPVTVTDHTPVTPPPAAVKATGSVTTPNSNNDNQSNVDNMKSTNQNNIQNDIQNIQNVGKSHSGNAFDDDNMNNYSGIISSPISHRLKNRKRMMQSGRRAASRAATVDVLHSNWIRNYKNDENDDNNNNNNNKNIQIQIDDGWNSNLHLGSVDPEILSPFNIQKFERSVDAASVDPQQLYQQHNM